MSMMEPSTPIAEPRPVRLRSAIKADVADVNVDMLTPKKTLSRRKGTKDPNRANPPIETAPMRAPAKIWGGLPCLSENRPMMGLVRARLMTWAERHTPISYAVRPRLSEYRGRKVSKVP